MTHHSGIQNYYSVPKEHGWCLIVKPNDDELVNVADLKLRIQHTEIILASSLSTFQNSDRWRNWPIGIIMGISNLALLGKFHDKMSSPLCLDAWRTKHRRRYFWFYSLFTGVGVRQSPSPSQTKSKPMSDKIQVQVRQSPSPSQIKSKSKPKLSKVQVTKQKSIKGLGLIWLGLGLCPTWA